eukprot:CAMPEP_0203751374 /NCGR_PEP_ID=MMETSP0098-20131031/5460_1 /ASSEMBLY_ACC=CAM_ASM_000208 /TAXON_ID=96639 /ORGANISM=" , Strain NY0313808BC1" /LENGTH=447 /DNA_ID=CAMNT_0050641069 /DNA_START=119 /DNA_END=1459 /DNA_ORIENTATION=-
MNSFNINTYASRYADREAADRLIFIAESVDEVRQKAYELAIEKIKKGNNARLYRDVYERHGKMSEMPPFDTQWVHQAQVNYTTQLGLLERELQQAKQNVIKEKIRMSLNDLGDFYFQSGDLSQAFKSYTKTHDYCTNPQHHTVRFWNMIRTSVALRNFSSINSHVTMARRHLPSLPAQNSTIMTAKLAVAEGLAFLREKEFSLAAKSFIDVHVGVMFDDVVSNEDIGVYGGLCAIASFSHKELKGVLGRSTFGSYLQFTPLIREIINCFIESKYSRLLELLDELVPRVKIDVHLHNLYKLLFKKIKLRAIMEYVTPFISVDLKKMAKAFNTDIEKLEDSLMDLIMDGALVGKIDKENSYLYIQETGPRQNAFEKTLQLGKDFCFNTQTALLVGNLTKRNITHHSRVKRSSKQAVVAAGEEDYRDEDEDIAMAEADSSEEAQRTPQNP